MIFMEEIYKIVILDIREDWLFTFISLVLCVKIYLATLIAAEESLSDWAEWVCCKKVCEIKRDINRCDMYVEVWSAARAG